jgi:glycosyltransferase involved in cell wall biosynthesis
MSDALTARRRRGDGATPSARAGVGDASPAASDAGPSLSVIIPARDAAATLGACLDGVFSQATKDVEVIVVDDGSRDHTPAIAAQYPVTLVRLDRATGAGGARNRGAAIARAPVLLFLDADVVPAPSTLARARGLFQDPTIDAAFGSYDDAPGVRTLVSLFKNLSHHYFHQHARPDATTFWAACGAVRASAFRAAGGFDESRYHAPSIEDVELGQRLAYQGARIVADPSLQVKHLKQWTLSSLLAADVRRRAIPWTLLILERRAWPADLNLTRDQLAAALIALALVVTTPFLGRPGARVAWIGLLLGAALINRGLFALFARRGGLSLMLAGFVLQQFYYVYAAAGFVAGLALYAWERFFGRSDASDSASPAAAMTVTRAAVDVRSEPVTAPRPLESSVPPV